MARKNVLVADDDPHLVEVLAIRLKGLGLRVRKACDAMTALKLIHDETPDLAILDVNMPAGNGLSVCEMMATDRTSSRIPVIILTGRTDPDTVRRCHNMLAYYVLKSPDVWRRVEPVVQELLDVRSPSGEAETVTPCERGPTGPTQ